MVRMAVLPTALLIGWMALVSSLTQGWQSWTYEAWRRVQALEAPWVATPLGVIDSTGQGQHWPGPDLQCAGQPCRIHIVDFFYTGCDSVCQVLGAEFQLMQQALIEHRRSRLPSGTAAKHIGLLSISMDIVHDDPAALQRYGARHQAQPTAWRLVTPRSQSEEAALRRSLGVVAVPDGLGGFVHNASLHVVNARGQVLGIFDPAQWREALALALRLASEAA